MTKRRDEVPDYIAVIGRTHIPSHINGKKFTAADQRRANAWRAYRRHQEDARAEKASRDGCFGVLLALLLGAGAIIGIIQQWTG